MTIPAALLPRIKDLLLFDAADTWLDALVASKWDEQRDTLCREYTLFAQLQSVSLMVGQSLYTVPAGTTRIASVIFRDYTLGYTDRRTLDLANPDWELAIPDTPRYWMYNALPGDVDTPAAVITPLHFLIHPAPNGAAISSPLVVVTDYRPATVSRWLEPILLYMTVAQIAAENPNLVQPEKGQFFQKLADYWIEKARPLLQV